MRLGAATGRVKSTAAPPFRDLSVAPIEVEAVTIPAIGGGLEAPNGRTLPIRCSPKVTLLGGTNDEGGDPPARGGRRGAGRRGRDPPQPQPRRDPRDARAARRRAVDGDLLIDEAWGEKLPLNPRGALQIALTRLRAWLGERTEPWITAAGGLYTLHLARDAVDVLRFDRLAADALRGQDLACFEEARHAWRGTPFPGHDSDRLTEARRTAEQRRRTLTVRHARLLLERDRPADVVDLLAGEDRLDEELSALLVRALRDGGRPRDAVETYLEVRRRLRDELDVEPGPELRSLYGSLVSRRPPRGSRSRARRSSAGRPSRSRSSTPCTTTAA